jgi:GNAT superfamily N-acetyltransferase
MQEGCLLIIREAVAGDADGIADIARRGWTSAYAGILPAEFLARRARQPLETEWYEYISAMPEAHTLLVAVRGDEVTGFLRCGPIDDEHRDANTAEIYGFYVAPEHIGKGVGRGLFSEALARLRSQSYRSVVVWTFTGNKHAERFYARSGFRRDGSVRAESESGAEERRWRADL